MSTALAGSGVTGRGNGAVTDRLVDLLVALVDQVSVTGDEAAIAQWLVDRYTARGEQVDRVGHSVVVGGPSGRGPEGEGERQRAGGRGADGEGERQRAGGRGADGEGERPVVLLVGHTDVVPPTDGDLPAQVVGDRVIGRGASDMKSGLAVAMDVFEDPDLRDGPFELCLVAYAGEEGPADGNELGPLLAARPDLAEAALGIVLEPTDLEVQLGCMGGLHAEVTVPGRPAHSARPWLGVNALTAAAPLLAALAAQAPIDRPVDGLAFRDVLTATGAWTDNARNVVPDRFTVNVNYRFAPDRTLDEAAEELRGHVHRLAGADLAVRIVDRAPPAPPHRDHPLVRKMVRAADGRVAGKQAWTDVARLATAGVPALNYGPGLTAQAHQAGEYVPVANLARARAVLATFLSTATDPSEVR